MIMTEYEIKMMKAFYEAAELVRELQYYTEILSGFCAYYTDTYHDLNRINCLVVPMVEKHKQLQDAFLKTEELLCGLR